jgi:cation diffusion facilitator CzcD-associated flavoprotein CzcO
MGVTQQQARILVIGAGMSGILMGIKLKRAGYEHVSIFEKANAVGGTWRDNTYPGLHCDVPSLSYCYSFAPREEWDKRMSQGEDIRAYFEQVTKDYKVDELIQFNTEVVNAEFKENCWEVEASKGDGTTVKQSFEFVITACGVLHHPVIPDFKGKDTFKGESFHTARWDHSVDLSGKRVGVIGTSSTAAQIIMPLSKTCSSVVNFQRTPQWIFPLPNREYSALDKFLAKKIPLYRKIVRRVYDEAFERGGLACTRNSWERKIIETAVKANLKFSVKDKELRKKLTPDYQPLCKRMIVSDNYYAALQQDNVTLETRPIKQIEAKGIRCEDRTLHELDVIVYATGFDTQAYMRPIKMKGLHGKTLAEVWKQGPIAYRTIAMPEFPNMFMIQGPNAPVGNFSLISTAESQSAYIIKCLQHCEKTNSNYMVPSQKACDQFNEQLVEAMKGTVWMSGCSSWYISDSGIALSWPWGPREFRESMKHPDFSEYEFG